MSLLENLRLDIADDEGINYAAISGLVDFTVPESPEILGSREVTSNIYTVVAADVIIWINPLVPGPSTVVLVPSNQVTGQIFYIKDKRGDAFTNNITLNPGANTIEGQSSFVMNRDRQSTMVSWNGTEWSIL